MASTRFQPGNPGGPGRPRGRITKFREKLGAATRDGQELVDELRAIWLDKANPVRERREALALGLAYLLGKPEQVIELSADVTAGPRLDSAAVLAKLSTDAIRELVAAADAEPNEPEVIDAPALVAAEPTPGAE